MFVWFFEMRRQTFFVVNKTKFIATYPWQRNWNVLKRNSKKVSILFVLKSIQRIENSSGKKKMASIFDDIDYDNLTSSTSTATALPPSRSSIRNSNQTSNTRTSTTTNSTQNAVIINPWEFKSLTTTIRYFCLLEFCYKTGRIEERVHRVRYIL